MRKEIKIGLLAIAGITILIWGYNFLKGQNIFKTQAVYHVKYENILKLQKSSPVYIHGYQVGNVSDIKIDPSDLQTIVVELEVLPEVKLPHDTKAILYADGVMGDMAIELRYATKCDTDCLNSGDFLEGETLSFLGSFLRPEELDVYMNRIKTGMSGIMDVVNEKMESDSFKDSELGAIIKSFKQTISNLESGTAGLQNVIVSNQTAMREIMNQLNTITKGLADHQEDIHATIQNVAEITGNLAAEDGLKTTLSNTNSALQQISDFGSQSRETLEGLDEVAGKLNTTLDGLNRGNGTLGKLITEEDLYLELKSGIRNLDLLLQDFRLNPKRYVNVSVFGKKAKVYTLPDEDPALESQEIDVNH